MRGMKLYDIPQAIRIHVFANGESSQRTEVVYAQTLTEVREVGFRHLYYDHTGIFDRKYFALLISASTIFTSH